MVIVLAVINRLEVLDVVLLCLGRFDRQVLVDCLDLVGWEVILNIYVKKVKLGEDVDVYKIVVRIFGFGGVDLVNIVNEVVLLAVRNKWEIVV